MQLNKDYVSFNSSNLKYDIIVAILTVVFYVYAVYNPACVQNGVNDRLYSAITNLYDMFFIGFVIGIIGVFFNNQYLYQRICFFSINLQTVF